MHHGFSKQFFFSCSALQEIENMLRGNLTICPDGHQLVSDGLCRKYPLGCLRDPSHKKCTSGNDNDDDGGGGSVLQIMFYEDLSMRLTVYLILSLYHCRFT